MQFLKETCLAEGSVTSGEEMKFDAFKFRALGLLWCNGDTKEKAVEFYDNMQDND